MGIILYLSLLASHEPVHWTIRCDGWKDLASEVRKDEYLDEQSKSDLINYFRTKVEEECDFKPYDASKPTRNGLVHLLRETQKPTEGTDVKSPTTLGETKWPKSHTVVLLMTPMTKKSLLSQHHN